MSASVARSSISLARPVPPLPGRRPQGLRRELIDCANTASTACIDHSRSLIASAPMSLSPLRSEPRQGNAARVTSLTPMVFWTVIAVTAVAGNSAERCEVLMSAWIPAPPPESGPGTTQNAAAMRPWFMGLK